ncbi:MAG: DUF2851 family protein [Flavobacteriales bacterium]|nr:DUF2851 family protein [Flavobacteriales bacterium]MBK7484058.1 DUF2851 family protein [Flavobacteriales bacterium]
MKPPKGTASALPDSKQTPRLHVVQRGFTDPFAGEVHPDMMLDPAFPYGEELLQFIWEQRLFDGRSLRTTDGRVLEIIRPGRIQQDSGPDLLGAEVRVDGQLWIGAVEVHLRSSDWNAHGHQFDPAYGSVVLHVVHAHDLDIRMNNGAIPPTLELHARISKESIAVHLSLMRDQGFVPCASMLQRVGADHWSLWLERVLVERLERKAAEVEALFHRLEGDPTETLYHMVAKAFGLKVNADPFGMLAHALPLKLLQKYRDDALRIEALLFGQAGMLQADLVDDHPRALQAEYGALAHLHGLRSNPLAAWKFTRMRPVNFPTIRIAQFAQLLIHTDGDLSELLAHEEVTPLHALLDVGTSTYWTTHYTFDVPSHTRAKRMGRAGSDHLIINAIVPTLFALGRVMGRPAYTERAMDLLDQLPPERNALLRQWAELNVHADTAGRGQALLELKNLYCTPRRCLSCRVGNQLLKNAV